MPITILPRLLALSVVSLLAACGGGGGGTDTNAATAPTAPSPSDVTTPIADSGYAVAAALKQMFQQGFAATLRGQNTGGVDITYQVVVGLAGTRSFEGTVRDVVRMASTVTTVSGTVTTNATDHYFDLATMTRYGQTYTAYPTYIVLIGALALPESAKPGDGGQLGGSLIYADATKSSNGVPAQWTWSMADIDGTSAWFCWNVLSTSTDGATIQRAGTCYRLVKGAAGAVPQVTGMKLTTTITANGVTTTTGVQ